MWWVAKFGTSLQFLAIKKIQVDAKNQKFSDSDGYEMITC